jgi:hypothetical protein
MALCAKTANREWQSCTRSKLSAHRSYKCGFHACGRNVSVARDLYIRYHISLNNDVRFLTLCVGCAVYEQGLPNILHEKKGTKGC